MQNINYVGTYTLYIKEVRRFLKVYHQTLFAPVVTGLLFLTVFSLAIGQRVKMVGDVPFEQFMAPGLIMMLIMQNAFANTSSPFIMGKVLGIIIDYLMPPLATSEVMFAMVLAGITRGIIIGILVGISITMFVPLEIYHIGYVIFFSFMGSMLLALLGLFGGIIAETFDQMSAVTSYIITPLTFLSGTFYPINNLPSIWSTFSKFNPFFYLIDGFRYGMTGFHDSHLHHNIIIVISINIIMSIIIYALLKQGYRIKT